jgi:hypothetical protein
MEEMEYGPEDMGDMGYDDEMADMGMGQYGDEG